MSFIPLLSRFRRAIRGGEERFPRGNAAHGTATDQADPSGDTILLL
jgi:hypothetical protein